MTMTGATDSPGDDGPIGEPIGAPGVRLPNILGLLLAKNRPIIMGVLNITPDSFSDGGQFIEPEVAFKHARQMIEEGADIIDIGAESTRPYGGAKPVTLEEELARLQPVLRLRRLPPWTLQYRKRSVLPGGQRSAEQRSLPSSRGSRFRPPSPGSPARAPSLHAPSRG